MTWSDLENLHNRQLVGRVSIMISSCHASLRTTLYLSWVVVGLNTSFG
jgi:hypothetical protein